MRFELQQTWDLSMRLKRWNKNGLNEFKKKENQFKKTRSGMNIAYCPKCGNKAFPSTRQLKFESSCCGLEWISEKPTGVNLER